MQNQALEWTRRTSAALRVSLSAAPLRLTLDRMKTEAGTLASIASIIAAFGFAMIIFRVQREEQMRNRGEVVWLPLSAWLLVVATLSCLLLVIFPISAGLSLRIPAAASAASSIAVAGYIPALLAHYRIVFGAKRKGQRDNPEPMELVFVSITLLAAAIAGAWVYFRVAI